MSAARDQLNAMARFEHARLKRDANALIDRAGASGARMYRAHPWAAATLAALGGAALAASWGRKRPSRRKRGSNVIASSLLGLVRALAVPLATAGIAAAQADAKSADPKSTVAPRRAADAQPTRVA